LQGSSNSLFEAGLPSQLSSFVTFPRVESRSIGSQSSSSFSRLIVFQLLSSSLLFCLLPPRCFSSRVSTSI
jgi:hypothetical protein